MASEANGKPPAEWELIEEDLYDIEEEEVEWLWPNHIPKGMISILSGDPGTGKSFLSQTIGALITKGGVCPDGNGRFEKGTVMILNSEERANNTIKPRMRKVGADEKKVKIIKGSRIKGSLKRYTFDLDRDIDLLARRIGEIDDLQLIVIDTITSYMGSTDSHKNADVRAKLEPLSYWIGEAPSRPAVLLISHLTKNDAVRAIYRTTGSLAFVALARSGWGLAFDREVRGRRILSPIKFNLGPEPPCMAFDIEDGIIQFEPESFYMSADGLISPESAAGTQAGACDQAEKLIRRALADGPRKAEDVLEELGDDVSESTLRRAKKNLDVQSYRQGKSWYWRLASNGSPTRRKSFQEVLRENEGAYERADEG